MKKNFIFLIFLLIAVFLSGCSYKNNYYHQGSINKAVNINKSISMITKELLNHKNIRNLKRKVILFTPLTNVNDLEESSNFGRLYSETLMTNFKRAGWAVVDNRKNLRYKNSAVLVGTYGEYQEGLLVNVRLLEPKTNEILASSNVHITDSEAIALSRENTTFEEFSIEIRQDDCVSPQRCEKEDNYLESEEEYYENENDDDEIYYNGDTI